jgi:hypothetical protein
MKGLNEFTVIPCMRNTDNRIHVLEGCDQKLVGEYARSILEAEKAVVSEYGADTHKMCM